MTLENKYVVPARSRWRIESKNLPELCTYTVDIQTDYFSKSIKIVVLDALRNGKPIVHGWITKTLNSPGEEEFSISHYDGNGNLLYKKILSTIKLIGHKCYHNYTCEGDDLQDHEILFTYEEMKVIENIN